MLLDVDVDVKLVSCFNSQDKYMSSKFGSKQPFFGRQQDPIRNVSEVMTMPYNVGKPI